jgi:hypothetical protein
LISIDLTPMSADIVFISNPLRLTNPISIPIITDNTDFYSNFMLPNKDLIDFTKLGDLNSNLA